jgi:hypothetical protein
MCAMACRGITPCVPGEQRACSCGNGLDGVQACVASGTFEACHSCGPIGLVDAFLPDGPPDAPPPDAPPDAALAATGAACGSAAECAGAQADCLSWPSGYCTSTCNPADSGADGIDPNCPGGGGYCVSLTGSPQCLATCTAHTGTQPCRSSYSCFIIGCLPDSFSQCDPTMAGTCTSGNVCWSLGPDPVGLCVASCDVFAQGCPAGSGGPQVCDIVNARGDEGCVATAQQPEGAKCLNAGACAAGLSCFGGFCRAFCGGPGAVACATGTCKDYSASIPSTTVGVCVP